MNLLEAIFSAIGITTIVFFCVYIGLTLIEHTARLFNDVKMIRKILEKEFEKKEKSNG